MTTDADEARKTYTRAFNEFLHGSNDPIVVAAGVGRGFDVKYGLWLLPQPRSKRRST